MINDEKTILVRANIIKHQHYKNNDENKNKNGKTIRIA